MLLIWPIVAAEAADCTNATLSTTLQEVAAAAMRTDEAADDALLSAMNAAEATFGCMVETHRSGPGGPIPPHPGPGVLPRGGHRSVRRQLRGGPPRVAVPDPRSGGLARPAPVPELLPAIAADRARPRVRLAAAPRGAGSPSTASPSPAAPPSRSSARSCCSGGRGIATTPAPRWCRTPPTCRPTDPPRLPAARSPVEPGAARRGAGGGGPGGPRPGGERARPPVRPGGGPGGRSAAVQHAGDHQPRPVHRRSDRGGAGGHGGVGGSALGLALTFGKRMGGG